ncbi:hypothetical protein E2562_010184 [Oryza meyeriana var. granulata]|uniref:Uncharacterized protein n=1 Tax=Oryza meyeriana var. granulata TaxID=110450 RepID=A0A6G1EJF1_9ORYZ|nr:hypothetical protein E2562_010184 [Oryza meyeriana var. granulata]
MAVDRRWRAREQGARGLRQGACGLRWCAGSGSGDRAWEQVVSGGVRADFVGAQAADLAVELGHGGRTGCSGVRAADPAEELRHEPSSGCSRTSAGSTRSKRKLSSTVPVRRARPLLLSMRACGENRFFFGKKPFLQASDLRVPPVKGCPPSKIDFVGG